MRPTGDLESAFPNAYISTDEPPRRSFLTRAACGVAVAGIGYLGLVILLLSLFSSEYSPVTQVASDYGVGPYSLEMNSGFFFAGLGFLSLSLAVVITAGRPVERIGGALLIPSGFSLIVNAFYQTDVEGAVKTFHGLVHGIGGAGFFFTAPVALLLVGYGLGRKRFLLTLLAFAVAVVLLAVDAPLSLNAAGLMERIAIMAVFSSAMLTAVAVQRRA